ncbi:hypothetical protein AVO45_08475 [Ruegeria marisrubri]|uniref:Uncharacterized protein n=1 Tax=Ruegeria marisrubri TaxID=1685379 RepID=A0A0X3TQG6_9RHOB|nr:hypothetical protein [Ruegeria marisrubri]KUJ77995.1 hypothetical protein AVO45_08475 [Ruegeria marisrubri]
MIARTTGAVIRGVLVALMVLTPALYLPPMTSNSTEIVVFLAIFAFFLTFAEYNSAFPSFIEFRDAPPMNRLRFVGLMSMVTFLTLICKHAYTPTPTTAVFHGIGALIANVVDFPYSPVRLVVSVLPQDVAPSVAEQVRMTASVAYVAALVTVASFAWAVRVRGWPIGNGAFNVWINLPLFDPTAGGDVVARMQRDGRLNILAGILLPFLIPALVKLVADYANPITLANSQTMVWTASAWAFLPASTVMRGIAMLRIAGLIAEKRRAYATAEAPQTA